MPAPHDLDAERAVLAAVLLESAECYQPVADILEPSDFYSTDHERIFAAMGVAMREGANLDEIVIRGELTRANHAHEGTLQALSGLLNRIPDTGAAEARAGLVRDLAAARAVTSAASALATRGNNQIGDVREFLDSADTALSAASERRTQIGEVVSARDAVIQSFENLTARAERKGGLDGMPCGLTDLDAAISGWAPGRLYVIAGRPGMGKSAVAKDIVSGFAKREKRALVFTLEMPTDEWIDRCIATESGVPFRVMRAGVVPKHHWADMAQAAETISGWPLGVCDTAGISVQYIARTARRIKREHGGLDCIMVDYLQLMRCERSKDSREQEVSEFARELKNLAKELKIPVIALSQLNRGVDSRPANSRRPMLSDLRESGAIEQDADAVIFVYRDEVYNPDTLDKGILEAIVGKNRSGPCGINKLGWRAPQMQCYNLEANHGEPDWRDEID